MKHTITSILAVLLLAVSALANVSLDTTYHSRFLDKGSVPYRGALVSALSATAGDFNGEIKAYVPTLLSQTDIKSAFARYDFTSGYTLSSSLFSVTGGATLTHVNKTPTLGKADQLKPYVSIDGKTLPVYLLVRYTVPTKQVNVETGASVSHSVGAGFTGRLCGYVGYNDISDQFPRALKDTHVDNRYYGGVVTFTHALFGGTAAVAGFINRADHAFQNTTVGYRLGYSHKL